MQGQQQLQLIALVASSSCLPLLQNLTSSKETTYFEEIDIMISSLLKQRPKKPNAKELLKTQTNKKPRCTIQECPRAKGSTEEGGRRKEQQSELVTHVIPVS